MNTSRVVYMKSKTFQVRYRHFLNYRQIYKIKVCYKCSEVTIKYIAYWRISYGK